MTIEEALQKHTGSLMDIHGVTGTGQGLCDGKPCIKVFVNKLTDEMRGKIPDTIEGYPVSPEETGMFRSL
ncbi:MAG: hypothetical protein ACLFN1_08585 [Bacteroidales bacterium]